MGIPLSVQFISFSCTFRQKFCQKIRCHLLLRGWHLPCLENPGSATGALVSWSVKAREGVVNGHNMIKFEQVHQWSHGNPPGDRQTNMTENFTSPHLCWWKSWKVKLSYSCRNRCIFQIFNYLLQYLIQLTRSVAKMKTGMPVASFAYIYISMSVSFEPSKSICVIRAIWIQKAVNLVDNNHIHG